MGTGMLIMLLLMLLALPAGFWVFWHLAQQPQHSQSLRACLQQQPFAACLTDTEGRWYWGNTQARQLLQTPQHAIALHFTEHSDENCLTDLLQLVSLSGRWQGEIWYGQLSRHCYQLQISPLPQGFLLWQWQPLPTSPSQNPPALTDPDSSLPNEAALQFWLHQQIALHQHSLHSMALLLLESPDLCRLRQHFGEQSGARLFTQWMQSLAAALPAQALVARISPDRLAILFSQPGSSAHSAQLACQLARDLLSSSHGPFEIGEAEVRLHCHAGLALWPQAGPSAEALQAHASQALLLAAQRGDTLHLWQPQGQQYSSDLQLQSELEQALRQYQCELWSQPCVELASGQQQQLAVELRWHSPSRGLMHFSELKPLARQNGQLLALERWAFGQLCQQMAAWALLGSLPVVRFELSAENFRHSGLLTFLQTMLADHGLYPEQLLLGCREDGWLQDPDAFCSQATLLQQAGFRLQLIEVGDGVCPLQLLRQPFWAAAELSPGLVANLEASDTERSVCASLIRLLNNQQLMLSAAGIEDEMQAYLLHVMGVQFGRGGFVADMQQIRPTEPAFPAMTLKWSEAS